MHVFGVWEEPGGKPADTGNQTCNRLALLPIKVSCLYLLFLLLCLLLHTAGTTELEISHVELGGRLLYLLFFFFLSVSFAG